MREDRIAMLGGSFDPIHLGHLFLLHCAVSMSDYRTFLIVPAKVSNFKQDNGPKADDADRLRMLELALQDYYDIYPQDRGADIRICDIELKRGGVSYTSDTIKQLKDLYGISGRVGMVMGDDHVKGLPKWHDYEYLRDNVEFLICRRQSSGPVWEDLPEDLSITRLEPQNVSPESSSEFRGNPEKMAGFLSARVMEYVRSKNLYH